jgi:hypothetical protein
MAKVKKKAGRPKKIVKEETTETSVAVESLSNVNTDSGVEATPNWKDDGSDDLRKGGHIVSDTDYAEFERLKKEEVDRRVAKKFADDDYQYIGDFDKGSSIPAWSLDRNKELLSEEVDRIRMDLDSGIVPPEDVHEEEQKYRMKKDRLDKINASRPELKGYQKDRLVKIRDELADELRDSKFTEWQMQSVERCDPHEEVRRMTTPCIPVDEKEAQRMGIKTVNGKANRVDADIMWKNMSSLIGDKPNNPNPEETRNKMGTGGKKRNMITVPDMPWLEKEKV